jgi:hypothetical protein
MRMTRRSPRQSRLAVRENETPSGDFFGNQSVLGISFCGQIEFEAVMKPEDDPVAFRSIACARVRTAAMREKREQEAKICMKRIFKQRKKRQNEYSE